MQKPSLQIGYKILIEKQTKKRNYNYNFKLQNYLNSLGKASKPVKIPTYYINEIK